VNDIPLSKPDIGEQEIDAVVSALKSSRLSLGPRLEEFEQRVADYVSVPQAIAVSSGTAGLHLCLLAMGIGPGHEVLVPSFTFIAAANVVRYVGAIPVFVDIEPSTLNMDARAIERRITPSTRAIMVVHTFGCPAEMAALLDIARRHKLLVLEDACEAIGAEYDGGRVGSFGDAGVFGFYPNKQITTGEGGVIVTRNRALAHDLRALRNQGRYESDAWHQHSILGYNYRLSEINAALGCAQMQRLDSILAARTAVAETYDSLLSERPEFLRPVIQPFGMKVSWFVYVVRLPAALGRHDRDEVVRQMQAVGIQCGRYFAPIHSQPAYANLPAGEALPATERESERTIALPFFTSMSDAEVKRVASELFRVTDTLLAGFRTGSRETSSNPAF